MCQWAVGPMANNYSGLTLGESDIWKSRTWGGQASSPLITPHIEVVPLPQASQPQVHSQVLLPRFTARSSFLVFQEVKLEADKPRHNQRVFPWLKSTERLWMDCCNPSCSDPFAVTRSLKVYQPLYPWVDSRLSLPPLQSPILDQWSPLFRQEPEVWGGKSRLQSPLGISWVLSTLELSAWI